MKLRMLLLLPVLAASLFGQTGARYLIIANDSFYNVIQPLAQWKTKKGMLCAVVKTSQTGTSSTQIRSYIVNAYNTWSPRPEFVLLVGNGSLVPCNYRREGQGNSIETDNPYGNISGDYQAELPYGRFPCNSVRQCSVMVAKTLDYERTPDMSDTNWYHHATTVCRDSTDDDAPTYWSDIHTVISEAVANGFSSFDSLASSRLQDSLDIRQSVNNGTAFVLYRGRGTICWYSPFDVRPYLNVDSLTNEKRLPIVCSFTCQTMNLANDTTKDMTGNTWVKVGTVQNPCGAVAVVGNTHSASGVALVRSSMTRGYFAGLFAESLKTVGAAMLRGKLQIYNDWHDSIYYMGFNLLGDPELNVWTTVPQPMAVDYDSVIPSVTDSFEVTVTGSGMPVANALVCIRSGSGIYQYGYTDVTGRQSFSINDSVDEMMDVTVTARNRIPCEGQARIYAVSAVGEKPSPQPAVRISVAPNPGRMRFAVTARPNARISIHSADGRLVWTGSVPASGTLTWNAQRMPVGIYVVSTVGKDGSSARALLRLVR